MCDTPTNLIFVPKIRIFRKAMGKFGSFFVDKIKVNEKRRIANEHKLGFCHIKVCNPNPQNGGQYLLRD